MLPDHLEYVVPGDGSDRELARPFVVPFLNEFVVNFLYSQHGFCHASRLHCLELTYLIFQSAGVVLGFVHNLKRLEKDPKRCLEVVTLNRTL